jgi:hypothetical protein
VNVYRRAGRSFRARATALALLLGALVALAAPAWAAAAEYTVNSVADGQTQAACEGQASGCTLRGAIEASDAVTPGPNTIKFDPDTFNGEAGDTIVTGLLPGISTPTTIDGAGCNAGSAVPCLEASNSPMLEVKADQTTLENLSMTIPSGFVGIRLNGHAGDAVLDNTISLPGTGLPSTGIESQLGASGALIEGNKITSAFGYDYSISLRGGSNRVLGNELIGAGCCQAGITIELSAAGNQIGGDTPESENLIENFMGGAVWMFGTPGFDPTHNEVRRNHGANTSNFISGAGVAEPVITEAAPSTVSGTAEPGATVRVFRQASQSRGELASFLGEAEADSVSGAWEATFAKVPLGTFVAATQTLSGSTSGVSESATVVEGAEEKAEREKAEREQREKEAAEKAAKEQREKEAQEQQEKEAKEKEAGTGGGTGTGTTGTGSTATPAPAPPAPAPAAVEPTMKITSGPKKTSTATTAKFKFKAEPTAGATFECKLDKAKWAGCKSPKTYKKLKPGKHTFQVRAKASGLAGPVTKYQFTVKS